MDDLFSSKSTEEQETAVLTDTAETEEPVAASEVPSLELPKRELRNQQQVLPKFPLWNYQKNRQFR